MVGTGNRALGALDQERNALLSFRQACVVNSISTGDLIFTLQIFEATFSNLVLKISNKIFRCFDLFKTDKDNNV